MHFDLKLAYRFESKGIFFLSITITILTIYFIFLFSSRLIKSPLLQSILCSLNWLKIQGQWHPLEFEKKDNQGMGLRSIEHKKSTPTFFSGTCKIFK
jgi:hypothetical protein